MTPQEFQKFYPLIAQWLRETLAAHARSARAVASCGFLGLPLYFKAETLSSAKVVVLDRLPMPPLSSWGLTQFADFERGDPDGVAYLDTFFLRPHQSKNGDRNNFFARTQTASRALAIGTARWRSWHTTRRLGLRHR